MNNTTPVPPAPPTLLVAKGFTVNHFDNPYTVELFPHSDSFNPCRGVVVGEEINNMFGTRRLIVKPTTPVTRRVTNQECHWPGNVLYVSNRDIL
jgi:hypothetical protein